jgi:hypothetical protein
VSTPYGMPRTTLTVGLQPVMSPTERGE